MAAILAVDDSSSLRQMVAFTLKSSGFDVIEAIDGQDAIEKLGITLVRHLRSLPQFKATPILILTTESSDEMKQAGRAAGATGWLVKPFDPRKLVDVIRKVLP